MSHLDPSRPSPAVLRRSASGRHQAIDGAQQYCSLNGYNAEREPPWRQRFGVDTEKDPDYLVDRGGDAAIVEVKHFTTTRFRERVLNSPRLTARFGGRDLYGNLQNDIRDAADQLEPFAGVGLALVALLTNPTRSDINFAFDDMTAALFGPVEWRVHAPPARGFELEYGSGEVLAQAEGRWVNRRPYLSAVLALYGVPEFPCIDVYDLSGAPGFTGTAVPRTMFDGDDDRWLGFDDQGEFRQLAGH